MGGGSIPAKGGEGSAGDLPPWWVGGSKIISGKMVGGSAVDPPDAPGCLHPHHRAHITARHLAKTEQEPLPDRPREFLLRDRDKSQAFVKGDQHKRGANDG